MAVKWRMKPDAPCSKLRWRMLQVMMPPGKATSAGGGGGGGTAANSSRRALAPADCLRNLDGTCSPPSSPPSINAAGASAAALTAEAASAALPPCMMASSEAAEARAPSTAMATSAACLSSCRGRTSRCHVSAAVVVASVGAAGSSTGACIGATAGGSGANPELRRKASCTASGSSTPCPCKALVECRMPAICAGLAWRWTGGMPLPPGRKCIWSAA